MAHRPNVVWFVMEDVSPRLGCYGDRVARTPNVDALAAEGRRYERAFTTAPVCAPARSALFTGCHPTALGTNHMRTTHTNPAAPELPTPYAAVPPHYVRSVTEHLRAAGYYCTLDVKADYQFGEPFTMWDRHAAGAGWWDEARDPDQPFFAAFTDGVTHESGTWPPGDDDQFGGSVADPETDPEAVDVPPYLPDTETTRLAIARQYDNLARADAWIGDLLDRLAADGHAADTLVVIVADHGEGLPRAKRWVYDAGLRVPLVVRWPGEVPGGSVDDRLVSTVDLGPTTLAACGVDVPRWVDGRPFLGRQGLTDDVDLASEDDTDPGATPAPEREYVFAGRDRYDEAYDMVRAVRDDRYKYVRHYRPGTPYRQWIPYRNRHPVMQEILERAAAGDLTGAETWFDARRPAEELYDLRADPHETENLAGDPAHAGALDRLRGALDDWRDRVDDAGETGEAEMVDARYLGGDRPETAPPRFVPNAPGNREREVVAGAVSLDAPATLSLYCATQGASIGYAVDAGGAAETVTESDSAANEDGGADDDGRVEHDWPGDDSRGTDGLRGDAGDNGTDAGPDAHWHLYAAPIPLSVGETTVRAKAVRYGYVESEERSVTVTVSA